MIENNKIPLLGKTLIELQQSCKQMDWLPYKARQITDWLYKKEISGIDEMTSLSKRQRVQLTEKFSFGLSKPFHKEISKDGTKKYLFTTLFGENIIETVYIPENKRHTVCVSSQCGCRRKCSFCLTGMQGYQGNLTANNILNQIRCIPEYNLLTNIVFMGMGEPLDNIDEVLKSLEILTAEWGFSISPRRITVSTIGVLPTLQQLLKRSKCHIAISLHSPFAEEREKLVPAQRKHKMDDVLRIIRNFPFENQRRLSFEYILFEGINDSISHADAIVTMLKGIKCRINLIRFHRIPNVSFGSSKLEIIEGFRERLNQKGMIATIRRSRGEDIFAACGLLSSSQIVK